MKCLLDSNIFIEAFKGNKQASEILDLLVEYNDSVKAYIPFNVLEEITFLLIKVLSREHYWNLKKDKSKVIEAFKEAKPYLEFVLELCGLLFPNRKLLERAFYYIEYYGLLPNDALVMATCKVYGIELLVSLDSDFSDIAAQEDIVLISSPQELKEWISR